MSQTDEFGQHEVLHLSGVFASMWSREILNHGAVQAHPNLRAYAEHIFNELHNFYQLVGVTNISEEAMDDVG